MMINEDVRYFLSYFLACLKSLSPTSISESQQSKFHFLTFINTNTEYLVTNYSGEDGVKIIMTRLTVTLASP